MSSSPFSNIPAELKLLILQNCTFNALLSLRSTSRLWLSFVHSYLFTASRPSAHWYHTPLQKWMWHGKKERFTNRRLVDSLSTLIATKPELIVDWPICDRHSPAHLRTFHTYLPETRNKAVLISRNAPVSRDHQMHRIVSWLVAKETEIDLKFELADESALFRKAGNEAVGFELDGKIPYLGDSLFDPPVKGPVPCRVRFSFPYPKPEYSREGNWNIFPEWDTDDVEVTVTPASDVYYHTHNTNLLLHRGQNEYILVGELIKRIEEAMRTIMQWEESLNIDHINLHANSGGWLDVGLRVSTNFTDEDVAGYDCPVSIDAKDSGVVDDTSPQDDTSDAHESDSEYEPDTSSIVSGDDWAETFEEVYEFTEDGQVVIDDAPYSNMEWYRWGRGRHHLIAYADTFVNGFPALEVVDATPGLTPRLVFNWEI